MRPGLAAEGMAAGEEQTQSITCDHTMRPRGTRHWQTWRRCVDGER